MDIPATDQTQSSIEEGLARLCPRIASTFPSLTTDAAIRKRFATTVADGFRALGTTCDLQSFSAMFDLLKTTTLPRPNNPNFDSVANQLALVIADQPSRRSFQGSKRCKGVAALAAIACMLEPDPLRADFPRLLKSLFGSGDRAWGEYCHRVDLLDTEALRAWSRPENAPKQIENLNAQLTLLVDRPTPTFEAFAGPTTVSLRAIGERADASHTAAPPTAEPGRQQSTRAAKQESKADSTANYQLFENQLRRSVSKEFLDGFRLAQWSRFAPAELLQVNERLRQALLSGLATGSSPKTFVHATARYISLFACMPLKALWGLPLRRRGSLHSDVKFGILRRSMLVLAPRSDRQHRLRTRGRWTRTRLPVEVADALRLLCGQYPTASTLGELVEQAGLTYTECQGLLNDAWPTSHYPEDARFALSLPSLLLEHGVHPMIVARLSGDAMITPPADQYYSAFTEGTMHAGVSVGCKALALTPPAPPPDPDRRIGSPRYPSAAKLRTALANLQKVVAVQRQRITTRSSIEDRAKFNNLYVTAVALDQILGNGGRGDRAESMSIERMFVSGEYVAFSDRRVDTYSSQRLCAATAAQTQTRKHFLQHVSAFGSALKKHSRRCGEFLIRLANGEHPGAPAFQLAERDKSGWWLRPVRRRDLSELASRVGLDHLNESRHFWFNALVEANVPQVAIDAHLGHHITGSEPFGYASGVSLRELCMYLRPILESIQRKLGLEPLVGLGQTGRKHLRLPMIGVSARLALLPNSFLRRKIQAHEFYEVRELARWTQDAPSTAQTLSAYEAGTRLRHAYRHQTAGQASGGSTKKAASTCPISTLPYGSLLWCLLSEELVFTEAEAEALYAAALTDGVWAIERLVVIEANHGDRPAIQRVVSRITAGAIGLARTESERGKTGTYRAARGELHELVRRLEPTWPAETPQRTIELLIAVMSHFAAVQVCPGALMAVMHKAPFIVAADLARLRFGRARVDSSSAEAAPLPRSLNGSADFPEVLAIVDHWADQDPPLGENDNRAARMDDILEERLCRVDLDAPERTLIHMLRADLSEDAPYRQLKVTTLRDRARDYALFCSVLRREGGGEADPDVYEEVFLRLGGTSRDQNKSKRARWSMLHLCAFFHQQGQWVPAGFLESKGIKQPVLPRLPVYTTPAELQAACAALDRFYAARGGTYKFAALLLKVWRSCGPRYSELRYAALPDFDAAAGLLHINSSGHNHLKTDHSRGSLPLADDCVSILSELARMREPLAPRTRSLLFCDSHSAAPYLSFDEITQAVHEILRCITGCPSFRGHDLRAAAMTDAAFAVEPVLERLCAGRTCAEAALNGRDVEALHRRFAAAARLARHASPLTTLRYYICSGLLDLRNELDKADACSPR